MSKPEGGGAHGLVGRLWWSAGLPAGPTDLPFLHWAALWAHLSMGCVLASITLVFFSGGPFNPCNACVLMSDWSVFPPWPEMV